MNAVVRNDLRDVEGLISRLLSIGETFRKNDKDWSHLKNREDWDRIDRASDERKKVQVERISADFEKYLEKKYNFPLLLRSLSL